MTILETRRLHWATLADCAASAEHLAARPGLDHAFITLHGPLGAGKTSFTRLLLQALGVAGRIKSPTYAVVESYTGRQAGGPAFDIHHFDFYRFTDPHEWEDAGLRELFAAPGLKLAEWPEQAAGVLPPADLALHITPHADESRTVDAQAHTAQGLELLG